MSAKIPRIEGDMSDEAIVALVRNSEYPVLTAKQISDAFGVTRQAVNKRICDLVDRGDLKRMKVGSSAVVYYPPGDYSMDSLPEPGSSEK